MPAEEKTNICEICHESFTPSLRHPHQKVCLKKSCKLAHKAKWQKEKMKNDKDYRRNQKQANCDWLKNNQDYHKNYRENHPEATLRNQLNQKIRNSRRKYPADIPENSKASASNKIHFSTESSSVIAKMDLVKPLPALDLVEFWLVPMIAKMDPVRVFFLMNKGIRAKSKSLF